MPGLLQLFQGAFDHGPVPLLTIDEDLRHFATANEIPDSVVSQLPTAKESVDFEKKETLYTSAICKGL